MQEQVIIAILRLKKFTSCMIYQIRFKTAKEIQLAYFHCSCNGKKKTISFYIHQLHVLQTQQGLYIISTLFLSPSWVRYVASMKPVPLWMLLMGCIGKKSGGAMMTLEWERDLYIDQNLILHACSYLAPDHIKTKIITYIMCFSRDTIFHPGI